MCFKRLNANWIVMVLALSFSAFAQGAVGVQLKADARWSMDFPDLPDTLAAMTTGESKPAGLTVRLPANYSREGKFPLFVFLNGNDGGLGDTLPLDRKTVGSNDFICANLPLFKRAFDKKDGGLVTGDDFETVSRAYRVMLQKLLDTVPNVTPERSAFGGFSNGAHTTALLLSGQDDFILRHFRRPSQSIDWPTIFSSISWTSTPRPIPASSVTAYSPPKCS